MKILWVNPHFLHPTTRGGQIRTLEMLKHLHRWHEIHYAALENPAEPEGLQRSSEYCKRAFPVPHSPPKRGSLSFVLQAGMNVFSHLPLAVSRYASSELRRVVDGLIAAGGYDRVVCDFLFAAPNISRLDTCVLFQHNVETVIWERQLENAHDPVRRAFFGIQARRMSAYEREVCRSCHHVIAVSRADAQRMEKRFDIASVSDVPTGVDVEYFTPGQSFAPESDLVFVGSMDWLANIDGVRFFLDEIFPLIRKKKPDCTVAIVGRKPPDELLAIAAKDRSVKVTGTVPDIRPYLWRSAVSIVPLRIGGGTRLKIFEAMAARAPVVSTPIGAEGLPVESGRDCLLAETPTDFAARCLELLDDSELRQKIAAAGADLVARHFSWEHAARCFEKILVSV